MKHSTILSKLAVCFISLLLIGLISVTPIATVFAQGDEVLPDVIATEIAPPESATPLIENSEVVAPVSSEESPTPLLVSPDATAVPQTTVEPVSSEEKVEAEALEDESDDGESEDQLDLGDESAENDALKNFTGVVRQSKPYTCGPASLATLRTQLGDETSEADVLDYITDLSEEKGVSLLALKVAAEKLGATVSLKKWSAAEILKYVENTKDPVLIHDEKKDVGGHFSVIREYDVENAMVELSDTEAGNIKYSIEDFSHIYTGAALVIYSGEKDEQLSDENTDISNDEAAAIWGKYVPVYMLAANNKDADARAAARSFKSCIAGAMNIQNKSQRNNARTACYSVLGSQLHDGLSTTQEVSLMTSYNTEKIFDFSDTEESGVGTKEIIAALEKIIRYQERYKDVLRNLDRAESRLGGSSVGELPLLKTQLAFIKPKYDSARVNKSLLESSISSKQSVVEKLERNINSGTFTSGGQTFQLGAVGSQISAQSANLRKLSAALSAKLDTLDWQISSKESQLRNVSKQKQSMEASFRTVSSQMYDLQKAIARKKLLRQFYYFELSQYNNLFAKALAYQIQADSFEKQESKLSSELNSLMRTKNSAQRELDVGFAEKARLERLKAFGDQEMQRNQNSLFVLKGELANLKKQLTIANGIISTFGPQVSSLESKIDALEYYSSLSSDLVQLRQNIRNSADKYGFTSIANTNIYESQRLIDEELAFVKAQDQAAQVAATSDAREISSIVVSLFPGVGEGYDVLTLISGKDPLTKERLTSLTKVFTVAGLLSGVGSGKIARDGGVFALEKGAKELGMSLDEIKKVAEEVAKEYSITSLDDIAALKGKLSLDVFMQKVKSKAKLVKAASKIIDYDGVAKYIKQNGRLPDNFITKEEAKALGWSEGEDLSRFAPGKSMGGNVYSNRSDPFIPEPDVPGRIWYEADINYVAGKRGGDRIVFSSDGSIIYKTNHYNDWIKMQP